MISEFPLFIFTTLGGLSAGLAIAMALFPAAEKPQRPWLAPLVVLVLLGVGTLGVLFHVGRPQLFFYALRNPSAGIAQEAYCVIVFGILVLVQLILAGRKGSCPTALNWLCGVAGVALMLIMGMAYLANVGTPAWANWATVPLFVLGDLALGLGLWSVLRRDALATNGFSLTTSVVLVLLAATLVFEGLHFASVGQSGLPFYIALIVAPALGIALIVVNKKHPAPWHPVALCTCVLVGVCVSRWFFYAASIV